MEKFKKVEILDINNVLNSLNGAYKIKFKYALKKNKDILKKEVEAIEEVRKTNCKRFEEFEQKRTELLKCSIEFNDYGSPVMSGPNMYRLKDDKKDEYNEKMKQLTEEYKDALDEREKELKAFSEFLNEEIEIDVFKFNNEDVPEEITQEQYDIIFKLIN